MTRLLSLVTAALALSAALVVTQASPAAAATCVTRGHAYFTQPGRAYYSGFEGDESLGIPEVNAIRNVSQFRVGGNGIRPGTTINFSAFIAGTGTQVDILPGRTNLFTRNAGSNCVVNESSPYTITGTPGRYLITALYEAGNKPGVSIIDRVLYLNIF
jgi:hypothetical protein